MTNASYDVLFDEEGRLRLDNFSPCGREVIEQMRQLLCGLKRRMFLPLDLLIVLLERGHDSLADTVAEGAEGAVESSEVLERLRALATEIEEERADEPPDFDRGSFSRGFSRILTEAQELAGLQGRERIEEVDLVRCVVWRAEALESASVRWAIRRLGEGGGDQLFDKRGLLRSEVFQDSIWSVLQGSMQIAADNGTPFLGTPHLVAMLCSVRSSTVWRSATARGLQPSRLREELLRLIGSKPSQIPEFHIGRKTLTPRMVRMLSDAARRAAVDADGASDGAVGEEHLVEAFLEDGGSSLELVQALGLESEIRKALGEPKVLEEALPVEAAIRLGARRHATPTLDLLGRDLTEEAMEGRLPEIIGRELELQRLINILLRKEQRNPLLTGEAGVGKTALAVALAQRIASGRVPKKLLGHRLVEINGASLMSGTSYRGDLESRIKGLLDEASRDVILFIDEAHAVFAPRSGSHAPAEIPNHFKSALASGDIAVVGATTEAEYRRWFEQDPALKRRFERIEVGEPDPALVGDILTTLVDELERDYEVQVGDDAVEGAIELSMRYLPEQRLPDKAKKLLMDACIARANDLSGLGEEDDGGDGGDRDEDGDTASGEEELDVVGREDVARQVFLKTGIPLERLLRGEISWWVGIEQRLNASVVGQENAVSEVARALVTGRLKRARDRRPMAVLFFVGPPGVGKATLAAVLAREVFNDSRALIRLDLSDFQESHSISRLIGSPPGYVGYEDEDVLVTPLRRRPSSVVLLEDFDKAHPRIQERILRFIDEGEIADTRGYTADASNAIFILSAHLQSSRPTSRIGFSEGSGAAATVASVLRDHDASLAARIDEHVDATILFGDLAGGGRSPAIKLLLRRIEAFVDAMQEEYRIAVSIEQSLRVELERQIAEATDARAIDELVEALLYSPVTDALLDGSCTSSVRLGWTDDAVSVTPTLEPDVAN